MMKYLKTISFVFRRGKEIGYRKAEKYYRAEMEQEIRLRDEEIKELREKLNVEYIKMQRNLDEILENQAQELKKLHREEKEKLENEIENLNKIIKRCHNAYSIFVEDLYEFAGLMNGQAAEANAVAIKGVELLQAVQTLNERAETIQRRVEKKDDKIKKLLEAL